MTFRQLGLALVRGVVRGAVAAIAEEIGGPEDGMQSLCYECWGKRGKPTSYLYANGKPTNQCAGCGGQHERVVWVPR